MTSGNQVSIFDGHNDLAYQLWRRGDTEASAFLNTDEDRLHITYKQAKTGGLAAGLFALFVPQQDKSLEATAVIDETYAFTVALQMADTLQELANSHPDKFRLCTTAASIDKAVDDGALAALLHLEGAEPVGADLDRLAEFYQRGVRSIGPLWSRRNQFGFGVPFSFPGHPDQGPGLTDRGKALVQACDEMNILLDVSHLNEAGFWDIAKLSSYPLIASHSNAYALCPSPRNLTDKQLGAIAASGGLVGACFATAYLRHDGQKNPDTDIELIIRQLDYLISKLGENHVGLGSDFDGAVLPYSLANCACLPRLIEAMHSYGFGADLIQKLCWQNWRRQMNRL